MMMKVVKRTSVILSACLKRCTVSKLSYAEKVSKVIDIRIIISII